MSVRWTQVKKLDSVAAFREHCASLGIEIPIDDAVDPAGVLAAPVEISDGAAGTTTAPNRFAVLPMEGWDGTTDGRPTDLVQRRWRRFGASGCGLVWGEATAVRADGRANPNQLILDCTHRRRDGRAAHTARSGPGHGSAAHALRPVVSS